MSAQEEMAVFGSNVKRLREKEGLTKKELASRLGLGVGSLTRLERGEIPPRMSVAVVFRAGQVFGVHPKELFSRESISDKK